MKVLSIHWGVCSSAALYVDGKIVAAVHEERFSRNKNDDEFPCRSIDFCLQYGNVNAAELDGVAIATIDISYENQLFRLGMMEIEDYLKQQKDYWYPKLYLNQQKDYAEVFAHKASLDQYPAAYWQSDDDKAKTFAKDREIIAADYLGISPQKVCRIEHHKAHAYYSYYASLYRNEPVLALTVDGFGDGLNATIGIFDSQGKYERVYQTDQCNIARIYRYMTLLLGMKPNEHEFKVMGLAPYGNPKYATKALDVFKSTLYTQGIEFKWKQKPKDCYFWFKDRLDGTRFDNIAWALQTWVEDLLIDWVRNAVKHYNIRKIVVAGGVAMNIKAMGRLAELDEVDSISVGGSAGDESLAISSAFCLAEDLSCRQEISWSSEQISPLYHLYLGPKATANEEEHAVNILDKDKYRIISNPTSLEIATLLFNGDVLGRCVGRMEFGQRSLGNRSILADPINLMVKDRINSMIKCRDFWMPFAPVIMDRWVDRYLVNPKQLVSPFMTLGFKSTDLGFAAMPSACHPADRTVRPQILQKKDNVDLYEILEEFEIVSGRGALLNTSFNLHGHPIVNTPSDAVAVLENSGLSGLIFEHFLILKNTSKINH